MKTGVPIWLRLAAVLLCAAAWGCAANEAQQSEQATSAAQEVKKMKLGSSAIDSGAKIDANFTVEGEDRSPPLNWSNVPEGTKSLALICDDPDAPSPRNPAAEPWVHWVLFNIPANVSELPEGISRESQPTEVPGARQGTNSWPTDNLGYRGPAPPPGSGPHRYFFKIYALDTVLELKAGATKQRLLKAISGHVLAEAELFGVCER